MGLFEGISEVSSLRDIKYLNPGNYRVRIKLVKLQKSRTDPTKDWFIIEMLILESDNLEINVGKEYSQIIDMSHDMAMQNIKIFVLAVSGVSPENNKTGDKEAEKYWANQLGEDLPLSDLCDRFIRDPELLKGIEMSLQCTLIKTKTERKPFTKHWWLPRKIG